MPNRGQSTMAIAPCKIESMDTIVLIRGGVSSDYNNHKDIVCFSSPVPVPLVAFGRLWLCSKQKLPLSTKRNLRSEPQHGS